MAGAVMEVHLEMHRQVCEELRKFPRGKADQNLFRTSYQQVRMNALGRNEQAGPGVEDAITAAVALVRSTYPAFEPTIDRDP